MLGVARLSMYVARVRGHVRAIARWVSRSRMLRWCDMSALNCVGLRASVDVGAGERRVVVERKKYLDSRCEV